ncbi:MAG: integrating conjugative element protein [Gammaproteobacteria bacterium]|nr:integrating conjugative element protein [Gammaproteobacteria bacterium]
MIPLRVEANVGLGFDCGSFNPVFSIKTSLNEIQHSALAVERQVLNSVTAAITELPLYLLSRADLNLYNLLTNAMVGAQADIAVSTKSCETMQSEIAAGQNPYAHWGQISLGDHWQQEIGTAELSGQGDITQARYHVSHDAGRSGVPWVNSAAPVSEGMPTRHAGGLHQPPIHVIHDTAKAGFAVMSHTREHTNHRENHSSPELKKVFPSAKAAADWIVNGVGDQTITTYNGGLKSSQAGVGLYADIDYQTKQLTPKLNKLVLGNAPLSVKNLQAVSPQSMALSAEMIHSIQKQPRVIQRIIVGKLAQNIAAMKVINKARLAIRILQSGRRVPAIYSNKAAQKAIQDTTQQLQRDIENILLFVKARQTLLSNRLSSILEAGERQTQHNAAVSVPAPKSPAMQQGAVKIGHDTKHSAASSF